jgi:outer membrane receptor protein involved in Fe transport
MKIIHLQIVLLLLPFYVLGQSQIKGKVTDGKEPMAFANVYLSDEDNNLIKGVITSEDGTFEITSDNGTYTLNVSFLGYKNWKKTLDITGDLDLGEIVIELDTELDTVVIVAKKKIFERKVDRMVFNVENSLSATGGDAIDALRVSPGLFVKDNQITMIGKDGMQLMINGRIMPLAGDDLINFLRTIPADDIKSIEIITNPPAKYDAAGNSGIINVVLKKGKLNSWNNSTSYSYTQAIYAAHVLRNNFSLKEDKYQMLVSLSGGLGAELNDIESTTFFTESTWDADTDRKHEQDFFSSRLVFDYNLTEKLSIGTQYLFNYNAPDYSDRTDTRILNLDNTLDLKRINTGFNDRETKYHNINAHMLYKVDTLDREISVDLDYLTYRSDTDRRFETNEFDANGNFLSTIGEADNFGNLEVNSLSARVDVEHPFEKINLSYGGKLSYIENNSDTRFFDTSSGVPVLDPNQTDEFEYEETIQALYISATTSLGEKWSAQVGLRYEAIDIENFSKVLNQRNKIDYDEFFPTLYLQYDIDDDNSLYANYGRRIDRPSYSALNPFRFYYDSNKYSEGNPFLRPSFTNNVEIGYGGNHLNANIFYSNLKDGMGPVSIMIDDENFTIISQENYYKTDTYGFQITSSYDFYDWWENYNVISYTNFKPELTNNNIDAILNGDDVYLFATSNAFTISEKFNAGMTFYYQTPFSDDIFRYGESYNLSFSFRYRMLDKKLNLSVNINDVFNRDPSRIKSITNGILNSYLQNNSSRRIRFSISYNFGNKDKKVNSRDSGNEDERDRL